MGTDKLLLLTFSGISLVQNPAIDAVWAHNVGLFEKVNSVSGKIVSFSMRFFFLIFLV